MFSAIPSLKYSCWTSPLMFVNGSTGIDGLWRSGYAMRSVEASSSLGSRNSIHASKRLLIKLCNCS